MAKIDKNLVDQFLKMAQSGGVKSTTVSGSGDLKNISLRVRGGTVTWSFRYKKEAATIGYPYANSDMRIDSAKEIANIVPMLRKEFDNAKDVEPIDAVNDFISAYFHFKDTLKDGDKPEAINYLDVKQSMQGPETPEEPTTWTLRQCIGQMLKDRARETHTEPLSEASADDYRRTMKRPECAKVMDTPAVLLTRGDIETVRNTIREERGLDPARKFVTHSRAALDYCFHQHVGASGLEDTPAWWLMLKFNEKSKPRERKPSLQDIARVILLAEHLSDNPAPGAQIDRKSFGKEVLHAFKFICFTVQRQGAGVQTLCSGVSDIDGGKLIVWKQMTMKGRREFALPIPQPVVDELPPLQNLSGRNFVFKSLLEQETPVSRSATYGVVKKLRKHGLFERNDISYFSPHDMRRTIVEVLDDAGLPAGASAVLDHAIKIEDDERQHAPKITSESYHRMQRIPLKRDAMDIWTTALLSEIAKQRREWVPVL